MVSKLMRIQLIAFVVIAVLGIVYVGGKYARLDSLVGIGSYTVKVEMPDSGGIFSNAEVSYRGVPVGRVGDMRVTKEGIEVDLALDSGGPKIPASSELVVANRSAIGEQYVDFEPTTTDGPYLKGGSVVPAAQTRRPVPMEELFNSVSDLMDTVPVDALRTTFVELGTAMSGRASQMDRLSDAINTIAEATHDDLPELLSLIGDSAVVLGTQAEQSSAIQSFAGDLDLITASLRDSDQDLRNLIDTGTDASHEFGDLLAAQGDNLAAMLGDTNLITQAADDVWEGLHVLMAALPALGAAAPAIAPGDGSIHMGIVLETGQPVPCTDGYQDTYDILAQMREQNPDFDDTVDDFPVNMNANCDVPVGNPTGVRSSDRITLADPEIPQPWDSKPKQYPDTLYLRPIAEQMAFLLGVTPR